MVNIQTSTVTNSEAVDGIVLDIDVVNRAVSKNLADLDKVVWLGKASVATKTVPPSLTITIEHRICVGCNFDVGSSHLDESIVCIGIFPECLSLECHLGSTLQF